MCFISIQNIWYLDGVCEWLFLNANWELCHLYHAENIWDFDDDDDDDDVRFILNQHIQLEFFLVIWQ